MDSRLEGQVQEYETELPSSRPRIGNLLPRAFANTAASGGSNASASCPQRHDRIETGYVRAAGAADGMPAVGAPGSTLQLTKQQPYQDLLMVNPDETNVPRKSPSSLARYLASHCCLRPIRRCRTTAEHCQAICRAGWQPLHSVVPV